MDTVLTAPLLRGVVREPVAIDPAAAFVGLIERELDGAYRLAAVILGDALEAEDAVHDAAVAAWAGFRSLRDPARFDAWFGRILVNGCRDRLRRRKRTPVVDVSALIDLVRDDRRAADVAGVNADRDAISRALARLEPEHQVALVLRYWVDLPVDAIAARLGVPSGTVKSRIHNGLRRLREALEDGPRR
ncbi:MAG TPA: sigma-70 family RNA polymerase sigma factor [Candidatus Acidoferrum sp.]|nr:sigma-70 family RNA polymerase sigma factor [Candidatus Acidoferrum sp.]